MQDQGQLHPHYSGVDGLPVLALVLRLSVNIPALVAMANCAASNKSKAQFIAGVGSWDLSADERPLSRSQCPGCSADPMATCGCLLIHNAEIQNFNAGLCWQDFR
jgi:hypothetical protein